MGRPGWARSTGLRRMRALLFAELRTAVWSPRSESNGHALRAPASETGASASSATRGFGASPGACTLTIRGKSPVLCRSSRDALETMHLGVAGRNRTDASGITTHGSAIELRPRPNARCAVPIGFPGSDGLGGRDRTCDLMLPKHPRCQLRYTEMVDIGRRGRIRTAGLRVPNATDWPGFPTRRGTG
jgi:hypothetical protein